MKKYLSALLALVLLLAVCAPALAAMPSEGVAWDDENRQVVLTLIENGTTGYLWALEGLDEKGLLALAENGDQTEYLGGETEVGAPSLRTWRFTILGAGTQTLTLRYARSWETDAPARVMTLTVSVLDNGALSLSLSGWTI